MKKHLHRCEKSIIFVPEMEQRSITYHKFKALRELYSDILASNINKKYLSRKAILDILYNSPAPRFYISEEKARVYVIQYKKGYFVSKGKEKRRMIEDLANNFDELVSEFGNSVPREKLWTMLVVRKAKSFYIKRSTIEKIIYHYGYTR